MNVYKTTIQEAQAYLERDFDQNLLMLGSLVFEPVETLCGVRADGKLVALGIVIAPEPNLDDALPTVQIQANNVAACDTLLQADNLPLEATWSVQHPALLSLLATRYKHQHKPNEGVVYFRAEQPVAATVVQAQQITSAEHVDLSPCDLSAVALSYWLLRGWHVFGVVEHGRLIGHAVAAYPIAHTEEVSAVFTAPEARGRGIAVACAAAAVANIQGRGKHAIYVSRKTNHASIRVAEKLGMQRLFETWEIETRMKDEG